MNTESVNARRVGDIFPDPPAKLNPGDFCWGENKDGLRMLFIVLPGFEHPDAIPCVIGSPGGNRVWGWDGNEETPTLQPSIHVIGFWHGYLTAGRLVSC